MVKVNSRTHRKFTTSTVIVLGVGIMTINIMYTIMKFMFTSENETELRSRGGELVFAGVFSFKEV